MKSRFPGRMSCLTLCTFAKKKWSPSTAAGIKLANLEVTRLSDIKQPCQGEKTGLRPKIAGRNRQSKKKAKQKKETEGRSTF